MESDSFAEVSSEAKEQILGRGPSTMAVKNY